MDLSGPGATCLVLNLNSATSGKGENNLTSFATVSLCISVWSRYCRFTTTPTTIEDSESQGGVRAQRAFGYPGSSSWRVADLEFCFFVWFLTLYVNTKLSLCPMKQSAGWQDRPFMATWIDACSHLSKLHLAHKTHQVVYWLGPKKSFSQIMSLK